VKEIYRLLSNLYLAIFIYFFSAFIYFNLILRREAVKYPAELPGLVLADAHTRAPGE